MLPICPRVQGTVSTFVRDGLSSVVTEGCGTDSVHMDGSDFAKCGLQDKT